MPDFQTTANETATKLTALLADVDKSQTSLDTLEQLVSSTETEIDTQWTELTTRAETMITQLSSIKEKIN